MPILKLKGTGFSPYRNSSKGTGFSPRGNAMSGRVEMSYFDDSETLENHRKKWKGMHKRGATFFILILGGLGLGGFVFIVTTCWDFFVRHEPMDTLSLVLNATTCSLSGLFWGAVHWHFSEKRYRAATKLQGLMNEESRKPS
jgi:hypothetical protein